MGLRYTMTPSIHQSNNSLIQQSSTPMLHYSSYAYLIHLMISGKVGRLPYISMPTR
jgi:hypothetical protein